MGCWIACVAAVMVVPAVSLGLETKAYCGPVCEVGLAAPSDVVRISVGARVETLDKAEHAPSSLQVYAAGAGTVLVAYAGRGEDGPHGSSTLWRVPCKAGAPVVVAHVDGADFGHSALSPDGRVVFFTGADGIFQLVLATRATRRLTRGVLGNCRQNQVATRDVVGRFVDARTLSFERGCGYGHAWNANAMVLRDPGSARMTEDLAPRPPMSSVAVDAGGGVWLSDGLCGDATTFNRVLHSRDRGDHWRSVPVKMLFDQPVRQVVADRRNPDVLLVLSAGCSSSAHVDAGWVYLTEDGGNTFRAVAVPPGIPASDGAPAAEQDPIVAVMVPDGRLDHLVLYGRVDDVVGDQLARWESRDGGRSWKAMEPVAAAPGPPAPEASAGAWTFTIRKDGMYRARKGEPALRVFPRR